MSTDQVAEMNQRMRRLEGQSEFLHYVQALLQRDQPHERAARLEQSGHRIAARYMKAAVAPLDTVTDANVAPSSLTGEWLSLLSSRTLLGRIAFRRGDFNTRTTKEVGAGSAAWTEEGEPIAITKLELDATVLEISKISGIVVFTGEMIKIATPAALSNINLAMLRTIGRYQDEALLNPSISAVAQKNPGSLTATGTQVSVTGDTLAAILADVESLLLTLSNAGSDLSTVVLALHPQTAVRIARLQEAGGLTPTCGARGGDLLGVPCLTSVGAIASGSPSERVIVAIDPSAVLVASGNIEVAEARFAALQMSDAPSTGAQSMVSMLQTESVALRFSRYANWEAVGAAACAYLKVGY